MSRSPAGQHSFPEWLVRRDETLAGALDNPLFLAFEIRRRESTTWRDLASDPLGALTAFVPLLGAVVIVLLTVLLPPAFCCWVILVAPATWALSNMMRGRRSDAAFVPMELSRALGRSIYRPVLQDLAMTPSRGRDYVDAIVLEGREGSHSAAGLCVAIPLVIFSAFYIYIRAVSMDGMTPGDLAMLSAFTVLMIYLARPVYWFFALSSVSDAQSRIRFAATNTPLRLAGKEAASSMLGTLLTGSAIFGVLVALGVLAVGLLYLVVLPALKAAEDVQAEGTLGRLLHEVASGNLPQFVAAGLFLALVPIVAAFSRALRRLFLRRLDAAREEGDRLLPSIFDATFEGWRG